MTTMESETIPARLRRLRKLHDLTQTQLAKKSSVSQGTIGNLESGLRGYGESLVDIAAALGVSAEYLRGESDDRSRALASLPADTAFDAAAALTELGAAIESMADQESRRIAIDMLRTYISNPGACDDLVKPIAQRLAGEIAEPAQRKVNGI